MKVFGWFQRFTLEPKVVSSGSVEDCERWPSWTKRLDEPNRRLGHLARVQVVHSVHPFSAQRASLFIVEKLHPLFHREAIVDQFK